MLKLPNSEDGKLLAAYIDEKLEEKLAASEKRILDAITSNAKASKTKESKG